MMNRARTFLLAIVAVGSAAIAVAALAKPTKVFMGRSIAPTMSYHGAGWLVRSERNAEENTDLLLKELRLANGDVACDLGSGNGYHSLRMARKVAPRGKVVAIDIQPEMLRMLEQRAGKQGIKNVETVLSAADDPKLGTGRCDLILVVDVYHELSDPAAMLRHMKRALTPKGRIALVEFRAEDPEVPIKPLHKMSKIQMVQEFGSAGLVPVRTFDGLPWQHLIFFAPKAAGSRKAP